MKVLINNQLINYTDEGSGRVLLFLHGWGANLNTFDQLAKYFSKKFRVIRFDFPGFGGSPKPSDDWSVDDYAKLTQNLLEKLKINKLDAIIAHSFGGRIVVKGIDKKYLNPDGVVLMGAASIKPKMTIKLRLYKIIDKIGKIITLLPGINKLRPKLRKYLYKSAGSLDYMQSDQMKKIFLNVINEDLTDKISSVNQPTLLIWGENDNETPVADARLVQGLIKNSKLVVIADAGHFVYSDAQEKVIEYLDEFLK